MRAQVEDLELIELIYAALLGESNWQTFLDRLTKMAPGCWSVLHANDLGNGEADVGLVSGRSAEDVADYPTYYHHISPWVQHCAIREEERYQGLVGLASRIHHVFCDGVPECRRAWYPACMESNHVQGTDSDSPPVKAELAERVRKIQKQAARMGFQSGPTDAVEADKAFMDDMWGED